MESPKDALTNLYKIEGVSSIEWITYVVPAEEGIIFRDHEQEFESLLAAESALRKDGFLVSLDATKELLWLFNLSGQSIIRRPGDDSKVSKPTGIAERYGLKQKSSGVLNAGDLLDEPIEIANRERFRKRKRSLEEHYLYLKASSFQSFQSVMLESLIKPPGSATNVNAASGSVSNYEDRRDIYSSFVTALVLTLSHLLIAKQDFISLGLGVLLRPSLAELGVSDTFRDAEALQLKGTAFLLASCLQSNGDLLIIVHQSAQTSSWSSRCGPSNPYVLLAPFGWEAMVQNPSMLTPTSQPDEIQTRAPPPIDWRRESLNILKQHAIVLAEDIHWVTVELYRHPSESAACPTRIEWPAQLCFQPLKQCKENKANCMDTFEDVSQLIDPLVAAEKWFLDSSQREQLIKEQSRIRNNENIVESISASDEEEIPIGIQSNFNDSNDIQNPAGIYPTPPDGENPQVISNIAHRIETPSNATEVGPVASDEYTEAMQLSDANFDHPSTAELSLGNYDHLEDDDLFGDVQNQMYANNGITEDDFSFFDKPDEDTFALVEQGPVSPTNNRILEPEAHASNISFVTSPENADAEIQLNEKFTILRETTQPTNDRSSPELLEVTDTQGLSHGPASVHVVKHTHGSHDVRKEFNVPKKEMTMDDKYASSGKFAGRLMEHPASSRPSLAPKSEKDIPKITTGSTGEGKPQYLSNGTAENRTVSKLSSAEGTGLKSTKSISRALPAPHLLNSNSASASPKPRFPAKALFQAHETSLESMHDRESSANRQILKMEPCSTESIQIAQIVADQVVYYDSLSQLERSHKLVESEGISIAEQALENALDSLFSSVHRCTLEEISSFESGSHDSGESRQPPIQGSSRKPESSRFSYPQPRKMPPCTKLLRIPDVLVKRGGILMDISLTALQFWKELGFRPVSGDKDITAFCICPDVPLLRRGAKLFLEAIGQTYVSLKLGTHSAGHTILGQYDSGVVAFPIAEHASKTFDGMKLICEQFGKSLSALAGFNNTILIYVVNPSNGTQSIRKLCELFRQTFNAYASNVRIANNPSDLVLQIIPIDWMGSESHVAIPSLRACTRLAKIIYDKCPLPDGTKSPFASGSAFQITEQLPRSIDFKVTTSNSYSPLNHTPVAHLGYVWNVQAHWLSAAVVNEIGDRQWSGSYHIGQRANPWPHFAAIAKEVWEIIGEAVDLKQDECTIYIAKTEPIANTEMEVWTKLAAESKVKVCLASIDENPPVRLANKTPGASTSKFDHDVVALFDTPEGASPDTNGLKPLEDDDPSTRLVDAEERRWSITSSASVSAFNGELQINNQADFGYLSCKDKVMFSMRLMQGGNSFSIEELLAKYYILGALSRARGIADELPWHLAVAKKAHAGVEAAMVERNT